MFRKIIQGKHTAPSQLLNRIDPFTKQASHVLILAQDEAQHLQHNFIGTEHLLLGLLREGEGVATQVLINLGIEGDQVRHTVEAMIGRGERIVRGEVALTPRSKKVFELAVEEAQRLNHRFMGTEHLLIGLIREGEGIAAEVLKSFGLSVERVRTETLQVLRQHQPRQGERAAILAVPPEA